MASGHNPEKQSSRQTASAAVDPFHPPHEERGRVRLAPEPDPNQYLRSAKFTTLDCLNEEQAQPFTLQSLILAEVFLAGGPCYVVRLWSEMHDRQKSINVGLLLFDREVMRMEQAGLLEHSGFNKTAITHQGDLALFALVLLGMLPEKSLKRLEAKGVKLASTQNILDVAPQVGSDVADAVGLWPTERPKPSVPILNGSRSPEHTGVLEVGCDELPKHEDSILDVAATAEASISALNGNTGGTGGEVSIPVLSSPLQSHDGTTIERLIGAVEKVQGPHEEEDDDDSGGIFGTGDPDEMAHCQHGNGRFA